MANVGGEMAVPVLEFSNKGERCCCVRITEHDGCDNAGLEDRRRDGERDCRLVEWDADESLVHDVRRPARVRVQPVARTEDSDSGLGRCVTGLWGSINRKRDSALANEREGKKRADGDVVEREREGAVVAVREGGEGRAAHPRFQRQCSVERCQGSVCEGFKREKGKTNLSILVAEARAATHRTAHRTLPHVFATSLHIVLAAPSVTHTHTKNTTPVIWRTKKGEKKRGGREREEKMLVVRHGRGAEGAAVSWWMTGRSGSMALSSTRRNSVTKK